MRITIKGRNLELTEDIKQYINDKIGGLEKFSALGESISEEGGDLHSTAIADVEVGIATRHHKAGKIYTARITLAVPKNVMRAESESEDIYQAIDEVKTRLEEDINNRYNKKSISKKHRAALIWKKIRSISPMAWLKNEFRKGKREKEKF